MSPGRLPLKPAATLTILSLLAGGCASAADYPSLARRPAEGLSVPAGTCPASTNLAAGDPDRVTGTAQPDDALPPPPAAPAVPNAELTARVAALLETASAAHRRFTAARPRAESLARVAGAKGSESWSVASVALATLDAERSQLMVSLAELDALYVADRVVNFGAESGDAFALSAAREQVDEWLAEEDRALDAIGGRLGS